MKKYRSPDVKGKALFSVSTAAFLCIFILLAVSAFAAEGGEAAHHADSAAQLKDFGWRVLNFAIIFLLLAWAVKKTNVGGILAERRASVRKSLEDAAAAREAAEKKDLEYSEKLEKASQEMDEIYAVIKRETEAEKERILAEAGVLAGRIREQAETSARREVRKARQELREEAARLAVELAERNLRENIGKSDQDRFVSEFIDEYNTKAEKSH